MNERRYFEAIDFIDQLDKRYGMNREAGWVYAMRNQELRRSLLKVGMTRKPPHERANELGSTTAVPGYFELVYFVHVCDVRNAEEYVHELLAPYRYQRNKEFFETGIGRATQALDKAAKAFPLLQSQLRGGSRSKRSKAIPQAFRARIVKCVRCGKKNRVRKLAVPDVPKCGDCSNNLEI